MVSELTYIINKICKELHIENQNEVINKVKELKDQSKKFAKERKLFINLQKLVKDCSTGLLGDGFNAVCEK